MTVLYACINKVYHLPRERHGGLHMSTGLVCCILSKTTWQLIKASFIPDVVGASGWLALHPSVAGNKVYKVPR